MKKVVPSSMILIILSIINLPSFAADQSETQVANPTALNRWIEDADFSGVTAKFEVPLTLDPWKGNSFKKDLVSGDGQSRCHITREYTAEKPATLTISNSQIWKVESPIGAQGISPANKKSIVDDLEKLRQLADAHLQKCKNYSLLFLPQEPNRCYQLLKGWPIYPNGVDGFYGYESQADGTLKMFASVNNRDEIFLQKASRGLKFRLVSSSGQALDVSCHHSPSAIRMDSILKWSSPNITAS